MSSPNPTMSSPLLEVKGRRRLEARLALELARLAPPVSRTVSEWADACRVIERGQPEPGPWRTARAEYLREFQDAFSDPEIDEVVGVFASQTGKTESLLNVLGYHIADDPSEVLFVTATLPTARSISKKRISPLVERILGEKLPDFAPGAKRSGQEILEKDYPGGGLAISGANSPASLAMRSCRIVLGDEVDRWAESAGSEGDPMEIVKARTSNYEGSSKLGWISSPGTKGLSRIWPAYLESDQRSYWVPCPGCGVRQVLAWEHVRFEGDDPDEAAKTARYVCPHCEAVWHEAERDAAVRAGSWVAKFPGRRSAGFWLSALYSPWQTFGALVRQWLRAQGDPERLKAFINTRLAELWDPTGDGDLPEPEALLARREVYPAEVPDGVLVLTLGADVQDDRIEAEILGTGKNGETWSIDYLTLFGDVASLLDGTDDRLDELVVREYVRASGLRMRIAAGCIDSGGHYTEEVYAFAKRHRVRRVHAIKGVGGEGKPYWPTRESKPGRRTARTAVPRARFALVGVDTGKLAFQARLKRPEPGPGYCHFPLRDEYGIEFFSQLTGEVWDVRYRAGRRSASFVRTYTRVEALDCRNYAGAAVVSLRPDFRAIERNLAAAEARHVAGSPAAADPKPLDPRPADPDPDPDPSGPRMAADTSSASSRPGRKRSGFVGRYVGRWTP